jgi:hypothetical protein
MTADNGLLGVNHRWFIQDSKEKSIIILHAEHNPIVTGHFGQFKTLEWVKAILHWPEMERDEEEYVQRCDSCRRNMTVRYVMFGLLDPLDIPERPWKDISIDFKVAIPESQGHTRKG